MRLGAIDLGDGTIYITDESVVVFFASYCKSFELFINFCLGKHIFKYPNSDLVRFKYDPEIGKKIDWIEVYESNKHKFADYSDELNKEFYNNIEICGSKYHDKI
jgi:hypothetical protein